VIAAACRNLRSWPLQHHEVIADRFGVVTTKFNARDEMETFC
jgi:hypothetical protein